MYGQCWKCGKWGQMERHHIFEGVANRLRLHRWGQRKFMEEQHATEEDFRRVFGRNYL